MPGLFVVATPIGNLQDISFRAIETLKKADLIACEDTRTAQALLKAHAIKTPLISYHKFNLAKRNSSILEKIKSGETVALISDAGTPGISDPGEELISLCIQEKIPVYHVPGPCALVYGLVLSGFKTQNFSFFGFLPAQGKERQQALENLAQEKKVFILYEAPHRLQKTLEDLSQALGAESKIAIARELTKKYEEIFRGNIEEAKKHFKNPRGEFVLVVEPPSKKEKTPGLSPKIIQAFLQEKLPIKQGARLLSAALGISKNQAYDYLVGK